MAVELKFCPHCGAPVTPNDKFCQRCGFNLVQARAQMAAKLAATQPAVDATGTAVGSTTPTPATPVSASATPQPSLSASVSATPQPSVSATSAPQPSVSVTAAPASRSTAAQASLTASTQPARPVPGATTATGQPQGISQPGPSAQALRQAPQTPATQPTRTKHHSKVGMVIGIIVLVLVVAAGAGSAWYFAKPQQLSRLADAASAGKPAVIASAMVDRNGTALTAGQVLPLSKLYTADPSIPAGVAKSVRTASNYGQMKVVTAGKILGVFPKYRVQVATRQLKVKTTVKKPSFTLAGSKVQAAGGAGEYILPAQLPGLYTLKIAGSDRTTTKTVRLNP